MSRRLVVSLSLIILALLFAFASRRSQTFAAEPPTRPTNAHQYGQIAAKLFELSAENKVDEAVKFSQVSERISRDAADKLREHLAWPAKQGWKYLDSEVAASKTVTQRVHKVYVMGHFDQGPVLLILRFYRADDGWFIQSFRFRHNLDDFIDSLPYDKALPRQER